MCGYDGNQLDLFFHLHPKHNFITDTDGDFDARRVPPDHSKYIKELADSIGHITSYDTHPNENPNKRVRIIFFNFIKHIESESKKIFRKALDNDDPVFGLDTSLNQSFRVRMGNFFQDILGSAFETAKFTVSYKEKLDGREIDIVVLEYKGKILKMRCYVSAKVSKRDRGNDDADDVQIFYYGEIDESDLIKFCKEKKILIVVNDKTRLNLIKTAARLGLDVVVHDLNSGIEAIKERYCVEE